MLWFFDTLVDIPVSCTAGDDGMSMVVSLGRRGDSPPYHIHHTEDELFHVLDGEIVLLVDGTTERARAGQSLLAPKGVPHTYRILSEQARWTVVTTHGDFERFVRAVSRPAETADLPVPSGPPTEEQEQLVTELAEQHGIEFVGPPLEESIARAA
ncbi:MAG TPA: cupin domain-containing protein [Gaiellaceae bacterium]|nr:cupin domain-containing protein [Gaiellaceae bacterium]